MSRGSVSEAAILVPVVLSEERYHFMSLVLNLKRTGVLLLNLGSPKEPSAAAVRPYLRMFLSDPRVIDLPVWLRWIVVHLFVLPFRPKQSAEAYRQIWRDEGSPLIIHTKELADALQVELGDGVRVRFAMRFFEPSLVEAMRRFREEGTTRLIVFPLYPQYASSSTGSVLEEVYKICASDWNVPALNVIPPFYDHAAYLDSEAEVIREAVGDLSRFDYYLMSFHGLPERHVRKSDLSGSHCLQSESCCEKITLTNRYCYRAQCFHSAREVVYRLGLSQDQWSVAFQSRLGRDPWIRPYSDEVLKELPKRGVKRLAVAVPSFTADCLETLEEIDIRGRETFLEAGGTDFLMVPSLNAHPSWVRSVAQMVREHMPS